jgi:hypothetical protein
MSTAALAAQLAAGNFQSTTRTLWWGVLLGLAALSRTMVLSMLVALVLAAVIRLLASGPRLRSAANVSAALVLGFLVAWTWYSASWRSVLHYLTSYGYGTNAGSYGPAHSFLSVQWWTFRLTAMVNSDVFLPLSAALVLCLVVGATGAMVRGRRRMGGTPRPKTRAAFERIRPWAVSDLGTVVVYFVASYLFLSSTRNEGWGFEVPLLAPAVILILASARRAPRQARRVAMAACCVAIVFSFVAQSGAMPGSSAVLRTVRLGPWRAPILDSRGTILEYTDNHMNSCQALLHRVPAARGLSCGAYVARWVAAAQEASRMVWSDATARGRLPVLSFATEDRFFNTNTVALYYQVAEHQALGLGLLAPQRDAGASVAQQLEWANLVFAGPASPVPSWTLPPTVPARQVTEVLRRTGFRRIDRLVLPDGRTMALWWKDQGPPTSPADH